MGLISHITQPRVLFCSIFGRRLLPGQAYFCAAAYPPLADLTCFPKLVPADSSGGSVRGFVSRISDLFTSVYSSRNNRRFGLDHDDKATCFPGPAFAGLPGGSVTVNSSRLSALLVPVSSSGITWWLRRDHGYRTSCFPGLTLAGLPGGSVFLSPSRASSRIIAVSHLPDTGRIGLARHILAIKGRLLPPCHLVACYPRMPAPRAENPGGSSRTGATTRRFTASSTRRTKRLPF